MNGDAADDELVPLDEIAVVTANYAGDQSLVLLHTGESVLVDADPVLLGRAVAKRRDRQPTPAPLTDEEVESILRHAA